MAFIQKARMVADLFYPLPVLRLFAKLFALTEMEKVAANLSLLSIIAFR